MNTNSAKDSPTPEGGQTDIAVLLSRNYSANASAYEALWAPIIHGHSRSLLRHLPISGARRVVDVGAGVGTLLHDIQEAAPKALVVGIDRAEGMIDKGPADFPRAVMDARCLAFEEHSFDVVTMAFVLFHLEAPLLGLTEAARIIRKGGAVGTLTWGDSPGYSGLNVWNDELDALGAAPADERFANHDLVDTSDKMRDLLERSGFVSIHSWTRPFEQRQSIDEFLAHRTGHGASKRRFDSLDAPDQKRCIERVRSKLLGLPTEDLTDRAEVVFAIAATRAS